MGEFYKVVNVSKNEFIKPHTFGDGAKFPELYNTLKVLAFLLRSGTDEDDGDSGATPLDRIAGRWAGDMIVVAGADGPPYRFVAPEVRSVVSEPMSLCDACDDDKSPYKDISHEALAAMLAEEEYRDG